MLQIGPNPIVSRREILRIVDPMLRGSQRARFQTLRDKKVVSGGVVRPIAGSAGRLRGTVHLFSTLNRDSARLFRHGHEDEAREVAVRAADLEADPGFQELVDELVAYAAHNEDLLKMLGQAPWRVARTLEATDAVARQMLLASSTAVEAARQANRIVEEVSRVAGWVQSIENNMASIRTLAGVLASLPTIQLESVGLDRLGAAVEVEWEQVDPGEVIVSTSGAVGSEPRHATSGHYTAFVPAPQVQVSAERWARLQQRLREPTLVIPSLPVRLPERS